MASFSKCIVGFSRSNSPFPSHEHPENALFSTTPSSSSSSSCGHCGSSNGTTGCYHNNIRHYNSGNSGIQFSVLTFNIFCGKYSIDKHRLARQIAQVQALGADVICLQECFDTWVQRQYIRAFPHHSPVSVYTQRIACWNVLRPIESFIFRVLWPLISMLFCVFCVCMTRRMRATTFPWASCHDSLGLLVLVRTDKFTVDTSKVIALKNQSTVYRSLGCVAETIFYRPRGMAMLTLTVNSKFTYNSCGTKDNNTKNLHPPDSHEFSDIYHHTNTSSSSPSSYRNLVFSETQEAASTTASLDPNLPFNKNNNNDDELPLRIKIVCAALSIGVNHPHRIKQTREVFSTARREGGDHPVIVCIDSNADIVEPEMAEILQINDDEQVERGVNSWKDVLLEKGMHAPSWSKFNPLTHGWLLEPDQRIDYIIYKRRTSSEAIGEGNDGEIVELVDAKMTFNTQETFVSDHFGILATFHLSNSGGEKKRPTAVANKDQFAYN